MPTSDDVLKKFKEKSGVVDAWKAFDDAGVDDAIRKNVDNHITTKKWLDEGLNQNKLTQVLKDALDSRIYG